MANERIVLYEKAKRLNTKLEFQLLGLLFFIIVFSAYSAVFLYDILFVGMPFSTFFICLLFWIFILIILIDSVKDIRNTYSELQEVEKKLIKNLEKE